MSEPFAIVGLSGGVDSAVAAAELLSAGWAVEGLFMRNWDDPDDPGYCPVEHDLAAARSVADHLGIKLRFVDFTVAYWHRVFQRFLDEYAAGRTPNPDILCNREIKFRLFLAHARELGADVVATGHYARVETDDSGQRRLLRGIDRNKDQSYFLHAIDREALGYVTFPLGEASKDWVRERARTTGLPNHDRPDSTGICFIGERRFGDFLGAYLEGQPGPMVTPDGTHMGEHRGLIYYTIGQRRGLGIGGGQGQPGKPWYVLGKDAHYKRLYVGQGGDHPWLYADGVATEAPHWLAHVPAGPFRAAAQVRYRQDPIGCRVEPGGTGLRVTFDQPVRAVTPGQSLVVYDGSVCLGGAVIAAPLPDRVAAARELAAAS